MHTNPCRFTNTDTRRNQYKPQNTHSHIYVIALLLLLAAGLPVSAQLPPISHLSTIQTAEPIGKGASSTTFGLLQYSKDDLLPAHRQRVNIGGFEELHRVRFQVQTFLVPVRFSYGLSDTLDLIVGGTFSTGGVQKSVDDFYELAAEGETPENTKRRIYEQPLFDGIIGIKYNLKPERNDNLPSISVGGDVQWGFTADDHLNSDNEFLDNSPADGFPFFGANTYILGTQRLGTLFKVHGGIGVFLTSKSLKTTDSFRLNWQLGGEIAVADNIWAAADFSRELPYAGVYVADILGIALRYEVSDTLAFQFGFNNLPGFQFNVSFGGKKAEVLGGKNLLF